MAEVEDQKKRLENLKKSRTEWKIRASANSLRTTNPIRAIVDNLKIAPAKDKPLIPLSIGDPRVFGNLSEPEEMRDILKKNLDSRKFNGYPPSQGYLESRQAVAQYFSKIHNHTIPYQDVFISSGCSHAIEMCIAVMANPGDTILVPRPGFPFYEVVCVNRGITVKYYNLKPEQNWEVDLEDVKQKIDKKTVAIVINNPSNPCGSSFSLSHIKDIIQLAENYKLPILSDEIYDGMVFEGQEAYSLARFRGDVPVLVVGGMAKKYLVPGWRIGWLIIHDHKGYLNQVREGMNKQSTVILGGNSLMQSILPYILSDSFQPFFDATMKQLEKQANCFMKGLEGVRGLKIIPPKGTMYLMVEILTDQFQDVEDDIVFTRKLIEEESVFVLPGQCFYLPKFFRIVFCAPEDKMTESAARIKRFCLKHIKPEEPKKQLLN